MNILFINGSPEKNGNTAAPEKWMLDAGDYTMSRFAGLYGLTYEGMATNRKEARELVKKL